MSTSRALFATAHATFRHDNGHILYAGSSGTGKSQSLISLARHKIRNPLTGIVVVDPEGEIGPACFEYIANPKNGLGWRKVHYLRPSSATEIFALPFLWVPDRNPLDCHNKAVRARTIFSQAVTVGAGDYGPRLQKYFYLGAVGLALTGRPLIDMPDIFGSTSHLREVLSAAYPHAFLRDAMEAVDLLNPRAQIEYTDPLVSRLMPIFGNDVLRRVFGPQPPLDFKAILEKREIAILDLSGLEHADAVLVGKAFTNLVIHEAMQREPNREPHAFILIDEAFDFITPDLARGFDRLRKRNIQLCLSIQRLAQLKKAPDDDAVAIMSAVIGGTRTKVIFRLNEPDDAEYMMRVMFTGFIPLNEWKDGTERPVAVGQHIEIVRNRSSARHNAEHEATTETESVAYSTARTRTISVTEADSESETDPTSDATAFGENSAESTGTASSTFAATGDSISMDPMTGGVFLPPTSTNLTSSASSGSCTTGTASRGSGTTATDISGSSHGRTTGRTTAITEAYGETESETHGYSRGRMSGTSRGTSDSTGDSETYVTTFEWMNSQLYSLTEQHHRLTGEIQNLALRECFLKIDNAKPVRTRTVDCPPAFKSAYFRRVMLPLFYLKAVAQSPYLFPTKEVDAAIAARLANLLAPTPHEAEHDFAASEPIPPHDDLIANPAAYAARFWDGQRTEKEPPGRRPFGELSPEHDRFRVLDGGLDADGDKDP